MFVLNASWDSSGAGMAVAWLRPGHFSRIILM